MPDSSQAGETVIDEMGYNQASMTGQSQKAHGHGGSLSISVHDRGADDGDRDALNRGDESGSRARGDDSRSRSRNRTPRSARRDRERNNRSGMDVSLDAGYMNRVDEIEEQNRS